jgi:uncharacterized SAM-binding protein YcdF (DUF218 family)
VPWIQEAVSGVLAGPRAQLLNSWSGKRCCTSVSSLRRNVVRTQGIVVRELLSYSFFMPPTIFMMTCLCGGFIALIWPRIGIKIVLVSSALLVLFGTPAMSGFLARQLASSVSVNADLATAQAIVVLGADIRFGDGDGVPDTIGLLTLDRLASAARLYRRLHVPIVVSGGKLRDNAIPLADLMREELENNFHVPVTYVEDASRTTYENALNTSIILKQNDLDTILVVVQDYDAARVMWSFKRFGIQPRLYLTYRSHSELEISDFAPSPRALLESFYALHEMIGLIYYKWFI